MPFLPSPSFPRILAFAVLLAATLVRAAAPGTLTVHFLDVGQGDAALILSPAGKSVLIDGGPPGSAGRLASRVSQLVRGPLDLVVLSHPHLDHLGGLEAVIGKVGAKRFLDPGFDHPSKAYAELLEFLAGRVAVLTPERDPDSPSEPITIGLGEGVSLTVLWPRRPVEPFFKNTRSDANSNSIVLRLQHGDVSFLFTGDAEAETEQRLVTEPRTHGISVLKVAHHGSRHSNTEAFLRVVTPRFAVISAGEDNGYGHPSEEALTRLAAVGARTFRTDLQGEIVATSDGKSVHFRTAREVDPEALAAGAQKGRQGHGASSSGRTSHAGAGAPGGVELGAHFDETQRSAARERSAAAAVADGGPRDDETQRSAARARNAASALPDGGTDWHAYAAGGEHGEISFEAAREPEGYLASRRSEVFHRANCRGAKKIVAKNLLVYERRADAARTRRPAGDCNP